MVYPAHLLGPPIQATRPKITSFFAGLGIETQFQKLLKMGGRRRHEESEMRRGRESGTRGQAG